MITVSEFISGAYFMYKIYNCKGFQVGKEQGYKTHSAVMRLVNNPRTTVYKHIWESFHTNNKLTGKLNVWSCKWYDNTDTETDPEWINIIV
jgi:hypothetical protein